MFFGGLLCFVFFFVVLWVVFCDLFGDGQGGQDGPRTTYGFVVFRVIWEFCLDGHVSGWHVGAGSKAKARKPR